MNLTMGPLGALARPLQDFWAGRNGRERMMITVALGFLLLALFYLLLVEPAVEGRDQMRKTLPNLRQQVAQMQAMARDVGSTPTTQAAPVEPVTRESMEASLARAGLKPQTVSVTGEIIRVQLNGASFASLSAWIEQAGKTMNISVTEASIVAQAQPDTVNATLTLRQQRRE